MNETNQKGDIVTNIKALLYSQGRLRIVSLTFPLLILDLPSWVSAMAHKMKEAAADANTAGEILNAVEAEQSATDLYAWLDNPVMERLATWPEFRLRAAVQPWVVTATDLDNFVAGLIARSEPVSEDPDDLFEVACLVRTDQRKFYVIDGHRALVNNTGPDVEGILVDHEQMGDLIAQAMLDAAKNVVWEDLDDAEIG